MNWRQFSAVLRLRWQIARNQWRKAGALNALLMMCLAMLVLTSSVFAFFGALIGGYFLLPRANPDHLLILFDAVAGGFLIAWACGLLIELQRSELLSLDKLLHLPVSLGGAFVLNYLSSWVCFSIAVFLPLTLGLSLALVATRGPAMLLVFPLFAGFLVMITGATYQLRGWLARLMENKRRRGTILMLITLSFILLAQAPGMVNLVHLRSVRKSPPPVSAAEEQELAELHQRVQSGEVDAEEYVRRVHEAEAARDSARRGAKEASYEDLLRTLRLANVVLPIGWLPFGAHTLAQGRLLPALLGAAGMFGLGFLCLWRSYLGTMKAYTGADARPSTAAAAIPAAKKKEKATDRAPLVGREIPFLPPVVSSVALASFCTVLRSPEGKMMLMSPLLIMIIYGGVLIFGPVAKVPPVAVTPMAILSVGVTLLSLLQLLFNTFGFDRSGFRAYILMPVARRDVLYGKNLSLLPLAVGLNFLLLCLLAFVAPLPASHLPATLLQMIVAYLLMCVVGNLTSIYAPTVLPTGSLKMNTVRLGPALLQFLCTMLLPLTLLPAGAAWGVEFLVEYLTEFRLVPWYLLLSAAECALMVLVYAHVVSRQGSLLYQRETRILEVVAGGNE